MLFYVLFCLRFLAVLAPKTQTKQKILQTDAEKSEAIFADVIKNISRVNSVLQELINNYEQLQKIYKSQEFFDNPEYSSDADADRFFKNNKKSNRDKERSFNQYSNSSKSAASSYLDTTQMIIYEEADKSHEVTPQTNKKNKPVLPLIERLTLERKPGVKTNLPKNDKSESSDDTSGTEETIESTTPKKPLKTTTKTTTTAASVVKSAPEIIFVDTHKKVKGKSDSKKQKIIPELLTSSKKIKTMYTVKEMPGNKDTSYSVAKTRKTSPEIKNTSKSTSKRFLQIELLPTNDDPEKNLTNKPQESSVKEKSIKAKINLRSQSDSNRSAKLFIANDVYKPDVETSSEMTDEDEALTKDLFKTNVLRQAYGDACLKLVIRKCYKACKNVLRISCRAYKCKSELKSCYKRNYKTGCDKAFEDSPNAFRRMLESEGIQTDLTRSGYLSVACQSRAVRGMPIAVPNDSTLNNAGQKIDHEVNILRDRYEKACQKVSRDKCQAACSHAQNATCVKYECGKSLKKNFRRNCGTQCKIAYSSSSKSRDSGSDDSGSDSDSESDSEESDASSY